MFDQIGFGTWALGGTDWGPIEAKDARSVLRTAWDLGVRHFDTAEAYGNGRAEQLLGQAFRREIRTAREDLFLAGKSVVRDPAAQRTHLERSLRRCGCEYFDRYYIHWPREGLSLPRAVEELARAREDRLIGEIALSNVSVEEYRQANQVAPIAAVQFGYSILWRRPEELGLTTIEGTHRVAYSPLAQGLLARPFPPDPAWVTGDHRSQTPLFKKPLWEVVQRFNQRYIDLCSDAAFHPAAVALGWLLRPPGRVDEAVVGGRRPDQLTALSEGIDALAGRRDEAEELYRTIDRFSTELQEHLPALPNMFGYVPRPCRNR